MKININKTKKNYELIGHGVLFFTKNQCVRIKLLSRSLTDMVGSMKSRNTRMSKADREMLKDGSK
jgi:hypothetical protein